MDKDILSKMKAFVEEKDICVLATVSDHTPHCSLMAYVASKDCSELYMVTGRDTTKCRNMLNNPSVSLLIDNRENHDRAETSETKALTVNGTFQRIQDEEKQAQVELALLERHNHLKAFLEAEDTEVFEIKIHSFLLLEGLTESYFEEV